ncbi:MAG: TonB-dependent receptor plug domain-containing protein [Terriglobia bacterium]
MLSNSLRVAAPARVAPQSIVAKGISDSFCPSRRGLTWNNALLKAMPCLLLIVGLTCNGWAASAPKKLKFWKRLSLHAKRAGRGQQAQESRKAKEQLTEMSLADLGNVEVTTVSKEPEEVWQTPAAVYVITQEDIRRSGATSLPEVLRLAPGVEVARVDSDHWSVGIRGFGGVLASKLLVLIDGRSVYTPLDAGVFWEAQNVPLEDVDRIEVIRGPGGTIWGANAVDGVINIITKSTKDTHGSLLSLGGGNVDEGTTGFRYGDGNGKGFNYRLYGMGFDRRSEFHSDGNRFDDWRAGQAGFRTDWDQQGGDAFTLQGDIYREAAGQDVAIANYSPPGTVDLLGDEELSGGNVLGRWKRVLNAGSDVQVQAYFDRTNHFAPQFGETRNTFDVDFLHHLTLPGHQDFLWGLGARVSPGNFSQHIQTLDFTPHSQTDQIYSAFVQDEIPLVSNRLSLTVGSKLEHNNYTGFEVQPSARLLWTRTPKQTFWASVTRAVRTPSRLDEDIQFATLLVPDPLPIPAFVRVFGNGNFFSEQLIAYEAGYRSLVTPKFYFDIATFHNDYNDLFGLGVESGSVSLQPLPLPHLVLAFPIVNALKGATNGFEIAPDWRPASWWELKGSYSYLNMDLERRPGSLDTSTALADEGSSPRNQVVLQSFLNLPKRFEFDQTYRRVSALPAEGVKGYGEADLRLGWRPTPYLEFSIDGQNLLAPHHVEFIGDPGLPVEIKRSAYGKITFRW